MLRIFSFIGYRRMALRNRLRLHASMRRFLIGRDVPQAYRKNKTRLKYALETGVYLHPRYHSACSQFAASSWDPLTPMPLRSNHGNAYLRDAFSPPARKGLVCWKLRCRLAPAADSLQVRPPDRLRHSFYGTYMTI